MMPKFGNGNGNAEKTKDQLYKKQILFTDLKFPNIEMKPTEAS
jgi:hypothetical protein